jgi:flagellar hook protein FlgE
MIRSLYTSLTGLTQNQKAMDIVGDNLANVNTTGYKAGRMVFQDLFSQTLAGARPPTDGRGGINPKQIGMGADLGAIDKVFTQGSFSDTGVVTDMAIEGNGFFVLQGADGALSYTRAGNFYFDRAGNLVNSDGLYVMGYLPDQEGNFYPEMTVQPIQLTDAYLTIPASATSEVNLSGTLDTRAQASAIEFDNFLTSATKDTPVFDLHGANGNKLDLLEGEEVRIKANANENTKLENLYSINDENLALSEDTPISFAGRVVSNNGDVQEFSFELTGSTLGEIADDLESELNKLTDSRLPGILDPNGNNFDVSINEEGQIVIERGRDGVINGRPPTNKVVELEYVSGTPDVQQTFGGLLGTYGENTTRNSEAIKFEKILRASSEAGPDTFNSLSSLAAQIQNAVNGNLSQDFQAYYDESTGTMKYYNPENNFPPLSDVRLNTDDIYGFEIDKALDGKVFEATVNPESKDILADDGNKDDAMQSKAFLAAISGDTTLDKLFNAQGENLGLVDPETGDGTIVYLDAKINDKNIYPEEDAMFETVGAPVNDAGAIQNFINRILPDMPPFSWFQTTDENGNPKTVDELVEAIKNYLGPNAADVTLEDGAIKVIGNPGKANEITDFDIAAFNAPKFNSLMDQYKYLQHADGGQLTTGQTLFDDRGVEHTANYNFEMVDNDTWKLRMTVPEGSKDQVRFNLTDSYRNNEIYIDFNPDGTFARTYYLSNDGRQIAVNNPSFTLMPANGTENIVVSDFNISNLVLAAQSSNIDELDQNGYAMGYIQDISADDMGTLVGHYSNGLERNLARVTLATFRNNNGLKAAGGTLFQQTANSGLPSFGFAGAGGRGGVKSGYLEDSNVDIAKEFVNMILMQRGFQANSRVITTADEMIQDVINMKR